MVDATHIEVETDEAEVTFTPAEEDKLAIAKALLGEAPPLQESLGSAKDLALDKSKSDGEIRYQIIAGIEALEMRRTEILKKTKEQEERDRKARIEARKRLRQINALEKAYLEAQTGRRRFSTQASQNIAEAMFNAGARVPEDKEKEQDETEED